VVPTELVLLGVIAVVFLVVFFFLYLELSTRKRRLIQEIKIILADLPYRLPEYSIQPWMQNSIAKEFKLNLQERQDEKQQETLEGRGFFDESPPSITKEQKDEAQAIREDFARLGNRMKWLNGLSIGQLEKIQARIEKYYDSELPKSKQVNVKSVLSRANRILDDFIPMNDAKRDTISQE